MPALTSEAIANQFQQLQQFIASKLTEIDGKGNFISDEWVRKEGGGGITMIMEGGAKIIKGGVAFSKVEGPITALMRDQMTMQGATFLATGVSVVMHSRHPMHPTMHMNVRYFETDLGECWFGGGIDLTPIYVDIDRAKAFHRALKETCDSFSSESYTKYKEWADDYFYLPHREETRGVGGIFFDHLKPHDVVERQRIMEFCLGLGRLFPSLYREQTALSFDTPSEAELRWQALRWSRYVEYNLLFDRGTKFGIISNGRTESILLSMPPNAQWVYNYIPKEGTAEFQTMLCLKKEKTWF